VKQHSGHFVRISQDLTFSKTVCRSICPVEFKSFISGPPVCNNHSAALAVASGLFLDIARRIGEEAGNNAIIVLSFRVLQPQRIDEMQEKLLLLSSQKLAIFEPGKGRVASSPLEALNSDINVSLNAYGKQKQFLSIISFEHFH
jgi:hypothetical protein